MREGYYEVEREFAAFDLETREQFYAAVQNVLRLVEKKVVEPDRPR